MEQTWLSLYNQAPDRDEDPFLFENPASYACTKQDPDKKLVLVLHIGSDTRRDVTEAECVVQLERWASQVKYAGTKPPDESYRAFSASCLLHLQTGTSPSFHVKAAHYNVKHRLTNAHNLCGVELAVLIYARLLARFCDYVVISDKEHSRDNIEALLAHWPKYTTSSRWYRPRPALVVVVKDDWDMDGFKDRLVSAMRLAKTKGKTPKESQVKQVCFRSVDVLLSGCDLPQLGGDSNRSAMACRQFPQAFHSACAQFS